MCFTRRVYFWYIIKILPLSPKPPSRREGGDFRLFYARGFAPCIPGAEPGRRWFDRRRRRPAYEPGRRWLRAGNRASSGGAWAFTRRVYFWRIIRILPPSPRPPSPLGKGETLGYFMQGASPLASPGLSRGGTGYGRETGHPAGACLLCRLPTLPFVYLPAPIPPTPFPSGEGGDFRLFYARGFAPCIPGAEPGRRWLFSAVSVLLCPYPPDPLPRWGRGSLYTLFRRGLTPPAPLRNKPARRWLRAGNRVPGGAWGAMGERRGGRRHPAVGRWGAAGREGASGGALFPILYPILCPIPV